MSKRKKSMPNQLNKKERIDLQWEFHRGPEAFQTFEVIDNPLTDATPAPSSSISLTKIVSSTISSLTDLNGALVIHQTLSPPENAKLYCLGSIPLTFPVKIAYTDWSCYKEVLLHLSNATKPSTIQFGDQAFPVSCGLVRLGILHSLQNPLFQLKLDISEDSAVKVEVYISVETVYRHRKHISMNKDWADVINYFHPSARLSSGSPTKQLGGRGGRRLEIEAVYAAVKRHHERNPAATKLPDQPAGLRPALRAYQQQALRWMLAREAPEAALLVGTDLAEWAELCLPGAADSVFVHRLSGEVQTERPPPVCLPSGGVLADEMGLGKTVEVLALVLINPRPGKLEASGIVSNKLSHQSVQESIKHGQSQMVIDSLNQAALREHMIPSKQAVNEQTLKQGLRESADQTKVLAEIEDKSEQGHSGTIYPLKQEQSKSERNSILNVASVIALVQSPDDGVNGGSQGCDEGGKLTVLSLYNTDDKSNGVAAETMEVEVGPMLNQKERFKSGAVANGEVSLEEDSWSSLIEDGSKVFGRGIKTDKSNRQETAGGKRKVSVSNTIDQVAWGSEPGGSSPAKRRSLVRESATRWYEQQLASTKPTVKPTTTALFAATTTVGGNVVKCLCGCSISKKVVQCCECRTWQHRKCVGSANLTETDTYFCPQCWQTQEPILSQATLIVSPMSICRQWETEIKKHVSDPSFTLLVYTGVSRTGFVQPWHLSRQTVVLTTYETLRMEINFADLEPADTAKLRHAKRFVPAPSPLTCLSWWRVCLDEAQMAKGLGTKAHSMARRLQATHRWAISGTPLHKSVDDLLGTLHFLGLPSLSNTHWWRCLVAGPHEQGRVEPLHTLAGQLVWRTAKRDVAHQINIPSQSEQLHWLTFSPVEEFFYQRQHESAETAFVQGLDRVCRGVELAVPGVPHLQEEAMNIKLSSLDRQTMNRVLAPLLRLRQACTHPGVARGNHIAIQGSALTMEELLESLIKKAVTESEEALRQKISALNGLAAVAAMEGRWVKAAERYRDVLRAWEENRVTLNVDRLQLIHATHNLADILDANHAAIVPTLRDDTLRKHGQELETQYMQRYQVQLTSSSAALTELTAQVSALERALSGRAGAWWRGLATALGARGDEPELMDRLRDTFDGLGLKVGRAAQRNMCSSIAAMTLELCRWMAAVEEARDEALDQLSALRVAAPDPNTVRAAVACHIRTQRTTHKCSVCLCETQLKAYESLVFTMSSEHNKHTKVGNVVVFGQLTQGTWQASAQETALKGILALGRSRHADEQLLAHGSNHIKMLDLAKKEFWRARSLWTQLRDEIAARDELALCRTKLRLRLPGEQIDKRTKEDQLANLHIVEECDLTFTLDRLKAERAVAESDLRTKKGQLSYLTTLRKREDLDSNPDPCPICQLPVGNKWSVLPCGHVYCLECLLLLGKQFSRNVKCAVCRAIFPLKSVTHVSLATAANATHASASADEASSKTSGTSGMADEANATGKKTDEASSMIDEADTTGKKMDEASGMIDEADAAGKNTEKASGMIDEADATGKKTDEASSMTNEADGTGKKTDEASGMTNEADGTGGKMDEASDMTNEADATGEKMDEASGMIYETDATGEKIDEASGMTNEADATGKKTDEASGMIDEADATGKKTDGTSGMTDGKGGKGDETVNGADVPSALAAESSGVTNVRGSHSAKVGGVIGVLLALRAADPDVKVLVFSTWEKVLDILVVALQQNQIAFERLKPGQKFQSRLETFKTQARVTVLLLPLHSGSKGLNLTEATHLVFIEPVLDPELELQALGRIHRIGQTKKTTVHRFLVRGSLEERIHAAVRADTASWHDNRVTLGQLRQLFSGGVASCPGDIPNGNGQGEGNVARNVV